MNRLHQLFAVLIFTGLLNTGSSKQTMRAAEPGETVIPFTLTANNVIVVSATLNGTDKLNLMFHTGASDLALIEEAVRKTKSLKFSDTLKLKAWGGEGASRYSQGNQLDIGGLERKNITVWEDKNSGKDTDGKFGLDFFQNRVVEIDFDQSRLTVHEKLPRKAEKYERLKIENKNGLLMVEGSCQIEGKSYANKFMLHSGYSGGILLDDAFAANTGVDGKIKITEESSLKDSFGNTIKVKKGIVPGFVLGGSQLSDVATGFFAGNLGKQKLSIIGSDVLKRFNIIFDLANNDLYLALRRA